MRKVLHVFGFGNYICRWIKTFYNDIKATVVVNGQMSKRFNIKRGCRQGDPISPYIFIMCVEILANMIRQNKKIQGIKINNVEHKISQFADDTDILLHGDNISFEETIKTINDFSNISGLFLNASKTNAIWLGTRRNSPIRYMQYIHIIWNPDRFKILGVWFTNDLKDCVDINIKEKWIEVKLLYRTWLKRQITPLGRVAILKSLILSKLVHLWILLPNPPDNILNMIQKSIFDFVWKSEKDRISRKIATKNIVAFQILRNM